MEDVDCLDCHYCRDNNNNLAAAVVAVFEKFLRRKGGHKGDRIGRIEMSRD